MYIVHVQSMYVLNFHCFLYSRSSASQATPLPVDCLVAYSKGFICSGGSGTLHLFEKTDDPNVFKKSRTVSIWVEPDQPSMGISEAAPLANDVTSLALSPSEEIVVCSTRTQQLYSLTLSAADLGKVCYQTAPT